MQDANRKHSRLDDESPRKKEGRQTGLPSYLLKRSRIIAGGGPIPLARMGLLESRVGLASEKALADSSKPIAGRDRRSLRQCNEARRGILPLLTSRALAVTFLRVAHSNVEKRLFIVA